MQTKVTITQLTSRIVEGIRYPTFRENSLEQTMLAEMLLAQNE
jgi:hypothetical protein